MSRAARLASGLDRRLLAPGTAHRLACVRLVLALTLGIRLAIGEWDVLAQRTDEAFRPVPAVSWLDTVPSASALLVVQLLGLVGAVLAVVGRWPRAGFALAWLALLFLGALHSSAGKIMHNEVLLLLACVPVLASPPGARIGDQSSSTAYGWVPRASLAVVGVAYGIAGLQKLVHSGPAWVTSENMRWVLYQGADAGVAPVVARWVAGLPVVPNLFALGAVTLELLAPLLLAYRTTRPFYVLAALGMHGSIALLLGLDYSAWVLTVVAVALPWDRLLRGPVLVAAPVPADGARRRVRGT